MTIRRLVPWKQLEPDCPYTRQHIGRLERDGKFPKRVKVGPGRVAWFEDEIEAWLDALSAARDTDQDCLRSNLPHLRRAA